jgi:biopolymer transport protein ExbB
LLISVSILRLNILTLIAHGDAMCAAPYQARLNTSREGYDMHSPFRSLAAVSLSLVLIAGHGAALAQPGPAPQSKPDAPASQPAQPGTTAPAAPQATAPVATPADPAIDTPAPTSDAAPGAQPQTAATRDGASQGGVIPAHMLPHDLTPWQMFLDADIVVKAVMVGLAFASVVTWTLWFAKSLELRFEKRRARRKNRWLEQAKSLAEAQHEFAKEKDPVARLVRAAAHEVDLSHMLPKEGVKERIVWQLERVEATASRRIGNGMGVLATIGATAPFVGLFGTVWGIMNSFIGISKAHTTSLAVVAPGIAEALLATAIGLVAAIPAVVIYNVFTRSIGGYRLILGNASANVLRLASRDLDRSGVRLREAAE